MAELTFQERVEKHAQAQLEKYQKERPEQKFVVTLNAIMAVWTCETCGREFQLVAYALPTHPTCEECQEHHPSIHRNAERMERLNRWDEAMCRYDDIMAGR